jgi:FlaA1/EpsC-like NDP-sugar epimerase
LEAAPAEAARPLSVCVNEGKTMKQFEQIVQSLAKHYRAVGFLLHAAVIVAAGVTAFLLRFEFRITPYQLELLGVAAGVWLCVKSLVFLEYGLHRIWWQYVSMNDLLLLGKANVVGSGIGVLLLLWIFWGEFPRSVLILDFVLCFGLTAGMRMGVALAAELRRGRAKRGEGKRVLIYGAGDAGMMLAKAIRTNRAMPYQLVGFLDDDAQKRGARVSGGVVFGGGEALREVAAREDVELVLVAMRAVPGPVMTRILNQCLEAGVEFKTMPPWEEWIEGAELDRQVRDVAVEDLLGRKPVRLDVERIREQLRGETVLVTGAAGSIGSELCRQIARFEPGLLVAMDNGETPLFFLERELRSRFPGMRVAGVVGSVQHRGRLDEVMGQYRPAMVFHAAAFKHVPMMEAHPFESVENNVLGTRNVAASAAAHGVRDFVMISTDKAVRPTNVMGVTKRLAEMVVRGMQNGGTKFVSVRFGNVLGSNGSVIPIFKEQIAAGGPVTVTHPEMQRYFMTIPEAAQLVLEASTLGRGGEIFVLDMGEPVKIADLAKNLILLSGLQPGRDITIEYSGARPGEKLYEELHLLEEETVETAHEKIRVFAGQNPGREEMEAVVAELEGACAARDLGRLVLVMKRVVGDYSPSGELLGRVIPRGVERFPIEGSVPSSARQLANKNGSVVVG